MTVKGRIIYRREPAAVIRTYPQLAKRALRDMVNNWHARYAPIHFEERGKRRYKYKPRSQRYERRKERKHGHRKALVFSGLTKLTALAMIRVTGSSKQARGRIRAPALNFHPHTRDELTRTTMPERRWLTRRYKTTTSRRLNRTRRRRTIRIR